MKEARSQYCYLTYAFVEKNYDARSHRPPAEMGRMLSVHNITYLRHREELWNSEISDRSWHAYRSPYATLEIRIWSDREFSFDLSKYHLGRVVGGMGRAWWRTATGLLQK
jgi:hypothetical protein